MKLLLPALVLVLLAPLAAAADPVCASGGTCVLAGSYQFGSCDQGAAGNSVSLLSYDLGPFVLVGASTSCYAEGGHSYTKIDATLITFGGPAGFAFAGASWSGTTFEGETSCDTSVFAFADAGAASQGVPCGSPPPGLPALLP